MRAAIEGADVENFTCLRHLAQVAIYRGLADRWMLFDNKPMNLLGRGMDVELLDCVKDQLSLNGVSQCAHFMRSTDSAIPGMPYHGVPRPWPSHVLCRGWRPG